MNIEPTAISLDELLTHAGWVRALARSLVRDDSSADDLVQETWMRALKRPPQTRDNLRGWLARVVRNTASETGRRSAHRAGREADAENDRQIQNSVPTPDELVGRIEAQRQVAEEILELEATLRTTLLLFYYEEHSAEEIALATDTPVGTVRWRLMRGREELRARLDARSGGDRSVWVRGLTPWFQGLPPQGPGPGVGPSALQPRPGTADGSSAASTSIPGSALLRSITAMSFSLKFALVAIPAALLIFGPRLLSPPLPAADPVIVRSIEDLAPSAPPHSQTATETRRETVQDSGRAAPVAEAGSAPQPSQAALDLAVVSMRAIDGSGQPLAGITVTSNKHWRTLTTADGRAQSKVRQPEHGVTYWLVSPRHARTESSLQSIPAGTEIDLGDITLPPGGGVRGLVLDPTGLPLEGAHVNWRTDAGFGSPEVERRSIFGSDSGQAQTDAEGRFELIGLPLERGRVWIGSESMLPSYSEPLDIVVGELIDAGELQLEAWATNETIRGRVLDPHGELAAFFPIRLRSQSRWMSQQLGGSTDENGEFVILVDTEREYTVTALPGHESAWNAALAENVSAGATLELQLTRAPTLRLDVVDEGGVPIEAFDVTLRSTSQAGLERADSFGPEAAREPAEIPALAGSFVIVVRAELHAAVELGPFDSGQLPEGVRCVLRRVPGLAGSVQSADAQPLAGVLVELKRIARQRVTKDGFPILVDDDTAARSSTDSSGRFALTPEQPGEYALYLQAPGHARLELKPIRFEPKRGLDLGLLTLQRGGALAGRVLVPLGKNRAGVIVGLSRGDGYAITQRADTDGNFAFEHLTPGPWWLVEHDHEINPLGGASSTGGFRPHSSLPSNIEIEEGRLTSADLDLAREPAVELVVDVELGGRSLERATVTLTPDQSDPGAPLAIGRIDQVGQGLRTQLDENGHGNLRVPAAGSFHLLIETGASDPWNITDSVELGLGRTEWKFASETGQVRIEGLASSNDTRQWFLLWQSGTRVALHPLSPDTAGTCTVQNALAGKLRVVALEPHMLLIDPVDWPTVHSFQLSADQSVTLDLAR